jgi:magnesium-transporting ATPase (P-type)
MNFPFPFSPQQITIINFFIITFTSVYITLFSKKKADMDKNYVKEMVEYAVNAGFVTALFAIAAMIAAMFFVNDNVTLIRTYIICVISIMGINGFLYISNFINKAKDLFRLKFFIPSLIILAFLPLTIHMFAAVRNYFELISLTLKDWFIISVICIAGIIVSYFVCKYNLIFRFLTNTGEKEKF